MAPQDLIDAILDEALTMGLVHLFALVEYEAREIGEVIDEVEKLRDVVCYRRAVRVRALQMFFVYLANTCKEDI